MSLRASCVAASWEAETVLECVVLPFHPQGLDKKEDVRPFVVRRTIQRPDNKGTYVKAPRVQRLITPERLRHKRAAKALKKQCRAKTQEEKAKYVKLVHDRRVEALAKRREHAAQNQ